MSQRLRTFTVRRDYKARCGRANCAVCPPYYTVGTFEMCPKQFERLTGLRLQPGESIRVRLVRGKGRGR